MNTYELDGKRYDVSKLSEEGQAAFFLLAQVEQEVNQKLNQISIYKAGAVALHDKVREALTDDAVLTEED